MKKEPSTERTGETVKGMARAKHYHNLVLCADTHHEDNVLST